VADDRGFADSAAGGPDRMAAPQSDGPARIYGTPVSPMKDGWAAQQQLARDVEQLRRSWDDE
jgi:hypothetical protein